MLVHLSIISFVALGGAIGSVARYGMMTAVGRWLGTTFPWGTLSVNVLGSFLMGVLIEVFVEELPISQELRAFLTVGVLGGFTTFSAFSLDAIMLFERGETGSAAAYICASVVLSVSALFAGLILMRHVL